MSVVSATEAGVSCYGSLSRLTQGYFRSPSLQQPPLSASSYSLLCFVLGFTEFMLGFLLISQLAVLTPHKQLTFGTPSLLTVVSYCQFPQNDSF